MKTNSKDISTFLHLANAAYWLDHPEDLIETPVRKKKTTHLTTQEAVCTAANPEAVTDFFHYIQLVEELGQLLRLRDSEHTDQ